MCYERLRALKCEHYESYQFDLCSTRMGRACKSYSQYILRREKHRSCYKCKAEKLTVIGVVSPSLGRSDQKLIEGKEAADADQESIEEKCWEKYLL